MELTKQDKAVLKVLVGKEMEHLKKDFKQLVISNSPFLNKVAGDQSDLASLRAKLNIISIFKHW